MGRPGRKANVLEAAVSLFSRKGYHGTTVRDIAVQSGMLSGSLYAHIAAKEDLLFEIVLLAAREFTAAVQPIAFGAGPAATKLREAMAAHLRVMAYSRDRATVFMHEWKSLSPERRERAAMYRDEYESLWAVMIRAGIDSGEFRPVDQKFARLLVLSAMNWVYQWYDPTGPIGPDALADRFAGLILSGLQTESAKEEAPV